MVSSRREPSRLLLFFSFWRLGSYICYVCNLTLRLAVRVKRYHCNSPSRYLLFEGISVDREGAQYYVDATVSYQMPA